MCRFLLIGFLIIGLLGKEALAQDKKISLGLNVYPNFTKGIIHSKGNVEDEFLNALLKRETWKPSISINTFIEYALSKKSSLIAGFGYQNNGERTRKIELVFSGPDGFEHEQFRSVYVHHNIEVPVWFKWYFWNKCYGLIGPSGIFNLLNTASTKYYSNKKILRKKKSKDDMTDFRKFNISMSIGAGMDFFKREQFTMFVQPHLQYSLLGLSKSASINRNSLSLGMVVGVKI